MIFSVALRMLLVISIVLQSLTAIASSASENHQVDIEHMQTKHDHKDDLTVFSESAELEHHDIKDCHHCGHCTGTHFSWVLVNNLLNTSELTLPEMTQIPYQFNQKNSFIDEHLRPPIS